MIHWMARNSVAANLLMMFIIVVGAISVANIAQEVFPEVSLDAIQITIVYPGASPEEVESGIVRRVEERIAGIDGIRRISSVSAENAGVITAQLQLGASLARALDDIKAEVDRIDTFPLEAEKPEIVEITTRRKVISIALHGDVSERALKELANRVKDDLSSQDGISYVNVSGTRDYEISIELREAAMRAYSLTLADITRAVRRGSLDLPGGQIRTRNEEILVRTKGQNYIAEDFRAIVVRTNRSGAEVRLGQIAKITDGFEEANLITRFNGERAAFVEVYRVGDERVLDIVDQVYAYVETLSVPAGIKISIWQDEARLLKSRYELMLKNGLMGLALVILALGLFLNSRLAFWVSMGIFVSFIGTFAVMIMLGTTLNMISLVAFILALGIVVDDAIMIGENIFAGQERGLPSLEAASDGASRLVRPVVFAVLTTMAAFAPLLFAPGLLGKFMKNLPIVIITVLGISLVESLLILPAHLSHVSALRGNKKGRIREAVERVQHSIAAMIEWIIAVPLEKSLRFATRNYGIVIVSGISAILLSIGLIAGGLVKFTFFPEIAGENVIARLEMPLGTPAEKTAAVAAILEKRGRDAVAEIQSSLPSSHPNLLKNVFVIVGRQPSLANGPRGPVGPGLIEGNKAEINIELLAAEERDISATEIESAWREAAGNIPGIKSLQFQSALITIGKPVQVELSSPDEAVLEEAVNTLKTELRNYAGVFDIQDDLQLGKRELKLELKPHAQSLGISLEDLASQVRAAFYGNEALRVQRGRDDVKVMVRLVEDERNSLADIENLRIRSLQGAEIPFSHVAIASFGYGPSAINRRDRRRVVTVTAELDDEIANANEVRASLEANVLSQLIRTYPSLKASFEGEQREQADTIAALQRGFLIALFVIYALLAIPFRSYTQPLIIMAAVPFGIIGAIIGHMLMGLSVGILSLFGIIGLSGVVVNDSLVLIDYINSERESGASVEDAIMAAGKARFRPIFLTSLTTFLGVLPLILEKSLQAQFLIPIAVSLGFGILFATVIVLILIPSLVVLEDRLRTMMRRSSTAVSSSPESVMNRNTVVIIVSISLGLGLVHPAEAQDARPEDVTTIEGIMKAYYEVVSGPSGAERDWARDRSLHHPEAQVVILRDGEDGKVKADVMTLSDFHGPPGPAQNSFYEFEIYREVRRHGANAHVWSTYEWRSEKNGAARGRGINSIQMYFDGSRWWITEWMFDSRTDDQTVQDAYLPENRWGDRLDRR